MKTLRILFVQALILVMFCSASFSSPKAGFYLPDSIQELSMKFRSLRNLVIIPVVINDSIHVNLILDTGCRNLVLFGKKFEKLFSMEGGRRVQFSGLGSGKPVYGTLSLNNKVAIKAVLGESIPVIVVPQKNLFSQYNQVHGVIGYDIFTKFEIELNPRLQQITFRPAFSHHIAPGYVRVPIRIEDSRPILLSQISLSDKVHQCDLMIDTGSSLGLLLKTTELSRFTSDEPTRELGIGFNGTLRGVQTVAGKLQLDGYAMEGLPAGVIESAWHNYASIGMEVLKDYSIILNYCKAYVGFKKLG